MSDFTQEFIHEVSTTRAEHLEMYAAAFIKEVGAEEASKYQLVERTEIFASTTKTSWTFEKKEEECH